MAMFKVRELRQELKDITGREGRKDCLTLNLRHWGSLLAKIGIMALAVLIRIC